MKKEREKEEAEQRKLANFTQGRELLRQRKEALKNARKEKEKEDYKGFLKHQVLEKQELKRREKQEETLQAQIFGENAECLRKETQHLEKENRRRQRNYKAELERQMEAKHKKTRTEDRDTEAETEEQLLERVLTNQKQTLLLKNQLRSANY